jgi:hypothetical protein
MRSLWAFHLARDRPMFDGLEDPKARDRLLQRSWFCILVNQVFIMTNSVDKRVHI